MNYSLTTVNYSLLELIFVWGETAFIWFWAILYSLSAIAELSGHVLCTRPAVVQCVMSLLFLYINIRHIGISIRIGFPMFSWTWLCQAFTLFVVLSLLRVEISKTLIVEDLLTWLALFFFYYRHSFVAWHKCSWVQTKWFYPKRQAVPPLKSL